ncbi:sulfotransferase family 5A, member 1 [Acanthochromis polyacanthus]|uniref:sulfotransferase family 5A, member 1 n=1 Tax=Acanthochromis polyacanthus TaxID=80966 RepID=UPI002234D96D|nr:sulfotransferase family 5A, member 1 [Acanthochromis polyacanthus]
MARLDVTEKFQGISFPGHLHTKDSLEFAVNFLFKDTDVLIVSYPKSGTTWMQEIVTLVSSRGDPQFSRTIPNWTRAPWLEHYYCAAVLKASPPERRTITTHLPFHLLGPALQGSKAKIIYVSRNPKDVAVSFYHFHKMANFLPEPGDFHEFLDHFLEGTLYYGSWFEHIKGWISRTATINNLLHITYEQMSLDLHATIKKVSAFLQCPLVEPEVNNCVKHCSFSSMRDNNMINYTLVPNDIMDHSKGSFMRKGEIGDWKNMFTKEQNQHFESVCTSKMKGCALEFVWEKQDKEETNTEEQT